jgi:hypothetical protein
MPAADRAAWPTHRSATAITKAGHGKPAVPRRADDSPCRCLLWDRVAGSRPAEAVLLVPVGPPKLRSVGWPRAG